MGRRPLRSAPKPEAGVNIEELTMLTTLMKRLRRLRPVRLARLAGRTVRKALKNVISDMSKFLALLIFVTVIFMLKALYKLGIAWRKVKSLAGRKT